VVTASARSWPVLINPIDAGMVVEAELHLSGKHDAIGGSG
jgi:hypothetical protein